MISAIAWIPRGAAKAEPEQAVIDNDDADAMLAAAQAEAQGASGVRWMCEEPVQLFFLELFYMLSSINCI